MPSSPRRGWRCLAGVLACLLLLACAPAPDPAAPATPAKPAAAVHGAATPEAAVGDLLAHLRRNALADVARTALTPDLHARVEAGWREGRSRWPLTELPLHASIPGMLEALSAADAETRLQARFRQQLSGQTRALQDAARGMGLFGKQYLANEPSYSEQQRQHYVQLIDALSGWAQQAPLGDPGRGRESVHLLVKAAERSGLRGAEDFSRLGMEGSLKASVPLYIAFKQVFGLYGLGVDTVLASVRTETVETDGDRARVRVRYVLDERDIETMMEVVRVDGRWYLADYLEAAEASLAAGDAGGSPQPPPAR